MYTECEVLLNDFTSPFYTTFKMREGLHPAGLRPGSCEGVLKGFNKGKSGGYRLYILIVEINNILAPICIYSKSDKSNLTYNELSDLLEKIKLELSL